MVVLDTESAFALVNPRCHGPLKLGLLFYHFGVGFMVSQTFVFEDKTFNGTIDFTGPAIDQKSGGLTGTDGIGGLWFGKLLIGNDTFLRPVNTLLVHGVMMVVLYGSIWTGMVICTNQRR